MPLYGHELAEDIDPLEAGLAWAVKFDKGDFVGRAGIVARKEDSRRMIRVRVGLEVEGRRAAREGAQVFHEGKPTGKVTSGTITPTLNRAIAMAYVSPVAIGTTLSVEVGRAQANAQVVALPFYRRKS